MTNSISVYKGPLVLLVDDNQGVLDQLSDFLQENGFSVKTALTSKEAYELVEGFKEPALLILDRELVDDKGNRVLGDVILPELNRKARFPITTIVHSMDNSSSAEQSAIRAGAFWSLPKGGDHDLFLAYVRRAIFVANLLTEPNNDPLTKALNRRAMTERVNRELFRAFRHGTTTACLMYDINNLKPVNDMYGHDVGDKVIIGVIEALREHLRPTDVVCRYGGDEILVFLFEVEPTGLDSFIERSCEAISRKRIPVVHDDKTRDFLSVSASVGCSTLTAGEIMEETLISGYNQQDVAETLIKRLIEAADKAMYEAKGILKAGK